MNFSRARRETLIATWLSYAGFYFTRKVFGVVKGPLKAELLLDDFQVSHLWTAYLVSYMLGQFVSAFVGRYVTSRKLLLWGMIVSAACNIGFALFIRPGPTAYVVLLLLMVIHGQAQGTGWPHTVAMVGNWTTRGERGTVMGVWGTNYQLGSVGGKAFASFMLGLVGLAGAFWSSSIVLLIVVVLFYLWAHERPEAVGLAPLDDDEPRPVESAEVQRAEGRVVRLIVAMGFIYLGFKFLRYALDSWSALILAEHFSISASMAGYLSTTFDWVGFAGVIFAGWISDRVFRSRRNPVIFAMTSVCLVMTVLLWWVGLESVWIFAVLLGLVGFFAMGPDSLLAGASAMEVGTRRQAALAAGVINGLGSIGPILQEPVIGWLKTRQGLAPVFGVLVGVVAMAVVGTAMLNLFARERTS